MTSLNKFIIGLIFLIATTPLQALMVKEFPTHKGMTEIQSEWGALIKTEKTGRTEKWIFDNPNQVTVVYLTLEKHKTGAYTSEYQLQISEVIALEKRQPPITTLNQSNDDTAQQNPLRDRKRNIGKPKY